MKAKKALKRLNRVESILSNIIGRHPASNRGLLELLNLAKASVVRAKKAVTSDETGQMAPKKRTLGAAARKRISMSQKKRWSALKKAEVEPEKPKRKLGAKGRKTIVETTPKRSAAARTAAGQRTAPKSALKKAKVEPGNPKRKLSAEGRKATIEATRKRSAAARKGPGQKTAPKAKARNAVARAPNKVADESPGELRAPGIGQARTASRPGIGSSRHTFGIG